MLTHVVVGSKNKKLGGMAATYRTVESCPTSCFHHPDNGGTCYGATGPGGGPFFIATRYGRSDLSKVLGLIDTIPKNGMLRLNVVGDFLTDDGSPDWSYISVCNSVALSRPDVTIIAYTHAWRIIEPWRFEFTVNASCETQEDVEKARADGWQAVITLTDDDDPLLGAKVADKRVIVCPEQVDKRVNCSNCGLCAKDRPTVVGFLAHGTRKRLAREKIAATR